MFKKIVAVLIYITLMMYSVSYANVISLGSKYVVTPDKQVTLNCNVVDSGAGMTGGKMKFRVVYTDTSETTVWTEEQTFSPSIDLALDVSSNREFRIQGVFSDAIMNWIPDLEALTTLPLIVDSNAPEGTLEFKVNLIISVTQP